MIKTSLNVLIEDSEGPIRDIAPSVKAKIIIIIIKNVLIFRIKIKF